MALRPEHEIHTRRRSRNVGLGVVLLGFVALVFALTVVKVQQGDMMEAFDHQPRVSLTPMPEPAPVEGGQ
jgi:ferric-dicitrate binding protein FerR (iron transport regulator)